MNGVVFQKAVRSSVLWDALCFVQPVKVHLHLPQVCPRQLDGEQGFLRRKLIMEEYLILMKGASHRHRRPGHLNSERFHSFLPRKTGQ